MDIQIDQVVDEYSQAGAHEVWKSWRDTMLSQNRPVRLSLMRWPIPEQDQNLDAAIAASVVNDFLVWAEEKYGLCLIKPKLP